MISTAFRFVMSAVLLLVVARYVDAGAVVTRLGALHPGWVALGLAISLAQVPFLAWRWIYTARRLGVELTWARAVPEYWLGILANQVLPGGVTGDVSRAWRHARAGSRRREAVTAVALERASAQVVMTTVAIVSVLTLPWAPASVRAGLGVALVAGWCLALIALRRPSAGASGVREHARSALLEAGALPVQLGSAVIVVASYLAVFLVAARALGVETTWLQMLPLAAPVLMTMLIPVSVAGWGVREGAAALLWSVVGLTPEEGAAISVTYGLIVLVAALPGVTALVLPSAGRGRRGRPDPA